MKRLETSLSHSLLELAYRHHVYELLSRGAVTESVLGKLSATGDKRKTTAPYEPLFKNLCSAWSDVNTDTPNLKILDVKKLSRILLHHMDEAKQFLKCWLKNDAVMRHDYLKMAPLCYVDLAELRTRSIFNRVQVRVQEIDLFASPSSSSSSKNFISRVQVRVRQK